MSTLYTTFPTSKLSRIETKFEIIQISFETQTSKKTVFKKNTE